MTNKHPGGAPTKYTEEMLEQAADYLENFKDHDQVIPTIAGLALHIGRHRSTVYSWLDQEDKPELIDILAKLMAKQEVLLVNKGLSGDFNSNIGKMMLTKHGYTDKQEIGLSGGLNLTDLSNDELDRKLKELEHKTQ